MAEEQLLKEVANLRKALDEVVARLDFTDGVMMALNQAANHRAFVALSKRGVFSDEEFATIQRFEGLLTDAVIEHLETISARQDEAVNEAFLLGVETVVNVLRQSRDKT